MSLIRLAFMNFKRSVREYGALIISLAFSVFVFYNFQNLVYSDSMNVLKSMRKEYIDMIIHAASVVFGIFLFFFIWYATNVFLTQRKKEIGIYTFMGLDNTRIGKLYALEAFFIGTFSTVLGLAFGVIFSKLFQMLVLRLSDISADIQFSFTWKPIAVTSGLFFLFFGLMILKGYITISKSSVLNLLSGARQNEIKHEKAWLTAVKVVLGISVLAAGYICSLQTGELSSMIYALAAVILVIIGTYLLFWGAIPFFIRRLTANKKFLYQKQRNLWVNNLAYRIQRNYRTYAMVTILMICSVTVLAISFALKNRYDKMNHFRNTYTYQIISSEELDQKEITKGISEKNQVAYQTQINLVMLDPSLFHTKYINQGYGVVSYSQVKEAARHADLSFNYAELEEDEVIKLFHVILLSLMGNDREPDVKIADQVYQVITEDDTAFLGEIQNGSEIYVVNDGIYDKLKNQGQELHLYNYKIKNPEHAEASRDYLNTLMEQNDSESGYILNNVEDNESAWIRVMYSICIFMFATLLLASGSIIFIKLNNDAYEDQERYDILQKLGIGEDVLYKSIKNEIRFTYYCPFVLMVITSWFSVKALGSVMLEDLFLVNVYSAVSILVIFSLIYLVSIRTFKNKVL